EKAPYFSGAIFLKLVDQRLPGKMVEEYIGSNLIEASEFKKILDFGGLTAKIGNGIMEVVLKQENIYEFHTKEGWKIILNAQNEPKSAHLNLITALDSN
ncbi:MAG: hypothetical protein AAB868_01845, partial [Patescibacteria group bacterium]